MKMLQWLKRLLTKNDGEEDIRAIEYFPLHEHVSLYKGKYRDIDESYDFYTIEHYFGEVLGFGHHVYGMTKSMYKVNGDFMKEVDYYYSFTEDGKIYQDGHFSQGHFVWQPIMYIDGETGISDGIFFESSIVIKKDNEMEDKVLQVKKELLPGDNIPMKERLLFSKEKGLIEYEGKAFFPKKYEVKMKLSEILELNDHPEKDTFHRIIPALFHLKEEAGVDLILAAIQEKEGYSVKTLGSYEGNTDKYNQLIDDFFSAYRAGEKNGGKMNFSSKTFQYMEFKCDMIHVHEDITLGFFHNGESASGSELAALMEKLWKDADHIHEINASVQDSRQR
ncbi:MAG TPA: hypothetical protein VIG80_09185 [Bacillaceae bacterium]